MKIIKRLAPLALTLTLLIAPASALAKTSKSAKAIKSSATAPVKPQSGCDQDCYQAFFDGMETCNSLHYIDEGLYADCVSQAQRNLGLCQFFCRCGGILGKAQVESPLVPITRARKAYAFAVVSDDRLFSVYWNASGNITPLMILRSDGELHLAIGMARICSARRIRRNLYAASAGSKRAIGYLNQCAIRYNKKRSLVL